MTVKVSICLIIEVAEIETIWTYFKIRKSIHTQKIT